MLKTVACAVLGAGLAFHADLRAQDVQPTSAKPNPPLCFKTTRLCIERKPTAATGATTLDLQLKPEDIVWMLRQVQLRSVDEDGTLEVKGELDESGPDIPGGVGSLIWAAKNPKQAWRIFMPVPSR